MKIYTVLLAFVALAPVKANACTLRDAREHLSSLNSLFQIYNREITSYKKQKRPVPKRLSEKRQALQAGTANIRKLFMLEVAQKADMKPDELVDIKICQQYDSVMKRNAWNRTRSKTVTLPLPVLKPEEEKEPACKKNEIRKRFGAAIRQQRKLTIAGKINKKEQIAYRKLATRFIKNATSDIKKACHTLHEYEKSLAAEKADDDKSL